MELWNAYTKNLVKLPFYIRRGGRIPKGAYHVVGEVIVRHADGSLLATRRSPLKSRYPGCWEISAGGAVKRGESFEQGAARELFEETGIRCSDLKKVYQIISLRERCVYMGYICETDCGKGSVRLQKGETSEYMWIDKDGAEEFIRRPDYVDCHAERIKNIIKELRSRV